MNTLLRGHVYWVEIPGDDGENVFRRWCFRQTFQYISILLDLQGKWVRISFSATQWHAVLIFGR